MNFTFGRVSSQSLTTFTRQLSTLQDAGLPILRSLHVLAEQERPGPLQSAISGVAADVESGESLASAMARHPKAFDRLYVNMVQGGETGGILDVILNASPNSWKNPANSNAASSYMIYPRRRHRILRPHRHRIDGVHRSQIPNHLQ